MGKVIPDDIWFEYLQKHKDDGLNSAQIARAIKRKYGIHVTRQAVWSRLDHYRRFHKL